MVHWAHYGESDTPGKAGGLMSGAASKAVGLSDGHRWPRGTVLRLDPTPSWFVGLLLLAQSGSALLHLTADCRDRPPRAEKGAPVLMGFTKGLIWVAPMVWPPQAPEGPLYSRNAQSCSSRTGQTSGLPQRLS